MKIVNEVFFRNLDVGATFLYEGGLYIRVDMYTEFLNRSTIEEWQQGKIGFALQIAAPPGFKENYSVVSFLQEQLVKKVG